MDTEILKLDAPYEYIFCNGSTALHIATLIVYEAKENEEGEYELRTHSHPIVKYLGRAGGSVWNNAELSDCDVICSQADMQLSLKRFRMILSHYPETDERDYAGTSLNPIWKKDLEDLGIRITWPVDQDGKEYFKEFTVRLDIKEGGRVPFTCQDYYSDFFFCIEADSLDELKGMLNHRRDWYYQIFSEHQFAIKFTCNDERYAALMQDLNATTQQR